MAGIIVKTIYKNGQAYQAIEALVQDEVNISLEEKSLIDANSGVTADGKKRVMEVGDVAVKYTEPIRIKSESGWFSRK